MGVPHFESETKCIFGSEHKWIHQMDPQENGQMLIWMFPKIGVPQNGWFIMENPIKMDDLGVPLFLETFWSIIWGDVFSNFAFFA